MNNKNLKTDGSPEPIKLGQAVVDIYARINQYGDVEPVQIHQVSTEIEEHMPDKSWDSSSKKEQFRWHLDHLNPGQSFGDGLCLKVTRTFEGDLVLMTNNNLELPVSRHKADNQTMPFESAHLLMKRLDYLDYNFTKKIFV